MFAFLPTFLVNFSVFFVFCFCFPSAADGDDDAALFFVRLFSFFSHLWDAFAVSCVTLGTVFLECSGRTGAVAWNFRIFLFSESSELRHVHVLWELTTAATTAVVVYAAAATVVVAS